MIDNAGVTKGDKSVEANTGFDDLVRAPKSNNRPTSGDDTLIGTEGRDVIRGRRGNDTIDGRGGNDLLIGGKGNDDISGGAGNDVIKGGAGQDTIRTGPGFDRVFGGRGNDRVLVSSGGGVVDGGRGKDTVVLKGRESDFFLSKREGNGTIYVSKITGDEVILRNVEKVEFTDPDLPPPPPPTGKGLPLAPNDAGAERIIIGKDSVRIIGPNTDFTFTGLRDQRPVDGPLTASAGWGVINGERTDAVPLRPGGPVFSLGSGFNATGTQEVLAAFANGVKLDSQIVRPGQPIPVPVPMPPIPKPLPPAGGQPLGPNSVGAERIIVSPGSVRILGPNTDFTFTGIQDNRPADGPLTATAGSGTINGVETIAVPLGKSDPFDPDASDIVFALGSGFNVTRTQTVQAAFATGERLDTVIVPSDPRVPGEPLAKPPISLI